MSSNDVIGEYMSPYSTNHLMNYEPDLMYSNLRIVDPIPFNLEIHRGEGYIKINLDTGELEIKDMTLTEAAQQFWEHVSYEYKQFIAWKREHETD